MLDEISDCREMNCLVSIVIPTKDRVRQLKRAVESCLRQTYKFVEVVIVDDGSSDPSYLADKFYLEDSRVRVCQLGANYGGSHARNVGALVAGGEYIIFLDSDDELIEDAVQSHLDYRRAHSIAEENVITYGAGRRLWIDRNGGRVAGQVYPARGKYAGESVGEYLFSLQGKIFTPAMMVSKSLLSKLLFNVQLRRHQDYGFVLDAEKKFGTHFAYIDVPVFNWISDFGDEGSRAKGVGLKVSSDFLALYEPHLTEREKRLYLFNVASAVAVASRDPLGLVRFYRSHFSTLEAIPLSILALLTAASRRLNGKLRKR